MPALVRAHAPSRHWLVLYACNSIAMVCGHRTWGVPLANRRRPLEVSLAHQLFYEAVLRMVRWPEAPAHAQRNAEA